MPTEHELLANIIKRLTRIEAALDAIAYKTVQVERGQSFAQTQATVAAQRSRLPELSGGG